VTKADTGYLDGAHTAASVRDEAGADLVARVRAKIVVVINESVPGTVTLHYKARDVTMNVTGDVALRMMMVPRRTRADDLVDVVDVSTSLALKGWVQSTIQGLLGIIWEPGVDARAVVDGDLLDSLTAIDGPDGGAAHVARLLRETLDFGDAEPDADAHGDPGEDPGIDPTMGGAGENATGGGHGPGGQ
jgi:hypothetical protein